MTDTVKPTVDAVVIAARTRTLRLLARVSRQQGDTYEAPAFLVARELYGPDVINVRTWNETYSGRDWAGYESRIAGYSGRGQDHPLNHGRPYAEAVVATTLVVERGGDVSRETSRDESRGGAMAGCGCDDCRNRRDRYDRDNIVTADRAPVDPEDQDGSPEVTQERTCTCEGCTDEECQGDCSPCSDHRCTQCHGDDFSCEDHDCDSCFPDHTTCDDCGYCSECGSHQGERDESAVCPNCSYCRECDHDCDNY